MGRLRGVLLVFLGCAAVIGAAVITIARAYRPEFEAWVREDLITRVRLVTVAMIVMTSGPALGFAGHLWRQGRQAAHGRVIQFIAAVLGVSALLLAFFLWRLVSLLTATPGQ